MSSFNIDLGPESRQQATSNDPWPDFQHSVYLLGSLPGGTGTRYLKVRRVGTETGVSLLFPFEVRNTSDFECGKPSRRIFIFLFN